MYDTVIVGLGSMGASALFQLAKQDVKVLGIERFGISHDKGSHSGQTRIVRKAYFEYPDYVPLLKGAYKGWKNIEKVSSEQLFYPNGLLYFGHRTSDVLKGVRNSAKDFGIKIDGSIPGKQYPVFKLQDNFEGVYEPEAGFALAEKTIRTYAGEARKRGAEIRTGEEVMSWKQSGEIVEVLTDKGSYQTRKLIVTAGAYTRKIIPDFAPYLRTTRQLIFWLKPKKPELFSYDNFPCWVIDDPDHKGIFYGFPVLEEKKYGGNGLMKVAHHRPGEEVNPDAPGSFKENEERRKIEKILTKYLPEALGEIHAVTLCMYTNTSDEHFIIDHLPGSGEKVIVAAGFSGHGFKFVPVMGEIIAELVLQGKTKWPIGFLKFSRF